ncbi:hypothetical protein L2750_05545 [Shewanella submarina]|uniref:Uncharacterized protein n=1 Tax=Shewanella submarina TaxID=2016376 RepID=A0ABV7G9I3_9GAMM|nr:hypothetical protein [Shewanella submarina]MCL1036615.1 hypothetical protein [Shewanella submarina]
MEIYPFIGLGEIRFGDTRCQTKSRFGLPDEVSNREGGDGGASEIWRYKNLGLELYFDPDSEFKLWSILTSSENVSFEGVNPIGLTDSELKKAFPNLKLSIHDGKFKEYSYPNAEIVFFLKNDVVKRIDIDPVIEEFPNKY